jgi:D-aspartate ligase
VSPSDVVGAAPERAERPCALVLGGSVLACSMVQELWENGVRDIVLFDAARQAASYSRRPRLVKQVGDTAEHLRSALLDLRKSYDRVVIFPNRDHHLAQLLQIRGDIADFCYLPFNPDNLLESLEKLTQYRACERLGVPYELRGSEFPVLLKPQEKTGFILRPFELTSPAELASRRAAVVHHLERGVRFLSSELIPGDGSNIHAYVAFRTADGRILAEWAGHKLSQHPNEFGVFASATNGSSPAVSQQGRTLVEGMDLQGIVEPEFKYDARDGRYKLTEINLRSMMWSRVGALSGVPVHYAQYLHATGRPVPRYTQRLEPRIHFVYLNNEIGNLIFRRGYWKTFRRVMWGGERRVIAIWDRDDPRPFLHALWVLVGQIASRFRRRWSPA